MTSAPLVFRWSGEVMEPLPRFMREADRQFVIGETYALAEVEERSEASHRHEFAWLKDAWLSLPESVADSYPSPEHLRKRGLIQAGFFNEQIIDAGSNAAALRVATAFQSREPFALVIVRGSFVVIREAKSQSRRAMNKEEFQASKQKLLEVISDLLGVTPNQLENAA